MERSLLIFTCFCIMLAPGCQLSDQEHPGNSPGVTTILVKLSSNTLSEKNYSHQLNEIKDTELQQVFRKFEIAGIRSVFKNRYNDQGKLENATIQSNRSLLSGWFEVTVSNRFNPKEFIAMLTQHKSVIDAVEDTPMRLQPDIAPNDASYRSQWHLNNPANPNFDIDAEAAWNINRGRNDVIIAVLDGGVDYNHPDLDPGNRSRVIAGIDTGDGDNDPRDNLTDNGDDFAGHGTMVAGVIGALTDNNQQVAGVMWNCKIMPLKMIRNGGIHFLDIVDWDWSKSAFPSDVADAIDYAVSHGAHVINLSYSFPDMGWLINDVALRVPLLADALGNAYQNNVVVTASMGNRYGADNSVRYPAGFNEYVIAVGGTDADGTKRASSNTGAHIDLSAPGTGILTTNRGGGIESTSGTSFSAPMVAGVAGLVISQGKDRNFNLTNEDVRHILELTATDDAAIPGFDEQTGHGIVNAHRALQLIAEPNVLYHYNSVGGTSIKTASEISWLLLSNRWGIAAAAYYKVDQYKITKRITFDIPFCTPPIVWLRERESKCLSYANPNDGRPYAIITNITNTGFDVEYVTYYVRYNVSAQEINKWIPAAPAATNVAYTVVGIPVPNISGPSLVCSSNNSLFTLNDLQAGSAATWTATPSTLFVTTSGTGTLATLRAVSGRRGRGVLTYNVTTKCGTPVQVTKTFEVGSPELNATYSNGGLLTFTTPGSPVSYNSVCNLESKTVRMTLSTGTGTWQRIAASPGNTSWSTSGNNLNFYFYQAGQTATFRFTATNACGSTSQDYSFRSTTCGSGCDQFVVTPNPSSSILSIVVPNIPAPCPTRTGFNDTTLPEIENQKNSLRIQAVSIYGSDGLTRLSKQFTSDTKKAEFDISNLQKGLYILKISDGEYEETHRIMKE